jgi:aspartate/methionine/tyrosine aminotransferase
VEVVYPNPGFPIYESMIRFCGATPVPMQLLEEKGYHPDLDDLAGKITDRTRLIILNSPENPCGSVLTREELETIAGLARQRQDLYVMSDEIYKDILYTGEHHSIAAFPGLAQRRRVLQELRHDRVAVRLRHHAYRAGAPRGAAGGEQRLLRRHL